MTYFRDTSWDMCFVNPPPPSVYIQPYYFTQVRLQSPLGKFQIVAIWNGLAKVGKEVMMDGEEWVVAEVYSPIFG